MLGEDTGYSGEGKNIHKPPNKKGSNWTTEGFGVEMEVSKVVKFLNNQCELLEYQLTKVSLKI